MYSIAHVSVDLLPEFIQLIYLQNPISKQRKCDNEHSRHIFYSMEAPYSSDHPYDLPIPCSTNIHPYDLPIPCSTNIKLIINDHIQSPVINSLFFHHLLYNNIVRKKFTLFPASRKRSVYIFPDLISGVEENRYVGEYLCHDGSVDCH